MEIFNRVDSSIQNISKVSKKKVKSEVSFQGSQNQNSASALESMAKAKISLDNSYSKPIPYETKMQMLKEREIPEEKMQMFLSANDEIFKEMILYFDNGLKIDEINSVYNNIWGSENNKKAAELSKFNIPYNFARDLFGYSSVSDEKIEFLKKAKFDFSPKREYFKVDEYALKRVLKNENEFEKFNSIYKRGVDANLALYSMRLRENELERLNKALDENKTLSASAAAAYCMGSVSPEDTQKIQELAQKHKLDANDYDFWLPVVKARDIERTGRFLELGVPKDCLKNYIVLNDEQVTEALEKSKTFKLSPATSFDIYQRTLNGEGRKDVAYGLINRDNMTSNFAIALAGLDNPVVAEKAADYIARGIEYYTAVNLAFLDKSDEDKEKIISLLPIFKDVSQTQAFIESDLSEEDSAKVLDLAKRGANLYLAKFCLESPVCYEKAKAVIDSNPEVSLENIYGGWEPEVLQNLDLISVGVPSDELSFFGYSATQEDIDLLKSGVKYSALKTMQEYEKNGTNCSELIDFLKRGVEFKTASDICFNQLPGSSVSKSTILEYTVPALEGDTSDKIMALASIQEERGADWITPEEKEKLITFVSELKQVDKKLPSFIDLGFVNDKALENYKELKKRGLSSENSNMAVILSQLDYKDSAQYDRVSEMIKKKVPIEKILYSMSDDKSFINAVKNFSNKDKSSYYPTLCSYLIKFYNAGLKQEEIEQISNECSYLSDDYFVRIGEYLEKGHSVKDAIKIAMHTNYEDGSFFDPVVDVEKSKKSREFLSENILKGCSFDFLTTIMNRDKNIEVFNSLIEQGFEPALAQKMVVCKVSATNEKKIQRIKELENATLHENLKKISGNPNLYPMIDELYNFNNYTPSSFSNLVNSNVSLQDLLNSGKTFVKSPLKQAMKRPNLYLTDIPQEHTEKVNGQYPTLPPDVLSGYQKRMVGFFKSNMSEITRALKYLDVDMFNQMMDKRTSIFSEQLHLFNKMDDSHYELASKLTKCRKDDGKLLSSKEKIDLSKIVLYHQMGYIDVSYLSDIIKNGTVSVSELNEKIFDTLIDTIGISQEERAAHSDKLDFDEDFMYLLIRSQKTADFSFVRDVLYNPEEKAKLITELEGLLNNQELLVHNGLTQETALALIDLLKRSDSMEEKDIFKEFCIISPFATVDITAQDIAKLAILHDFKSYVQDEANSIGEVNAKTKQKFENLGLDYDKWVNYQEKDSIEFGNNKYEVKLWDRKPQKDLFMGNRTSCCTAIIDGGNGKATPIYLSNTAFNVVELTDENGNIVAMSRIFVGKVDEKPSVVVENIEINNAFLKNRNESELKELRDKMFGYIGGLASSISNGQDMNIYFSKNYTHVPLSGFEVEPKKVEFVGEISSDTVYLNCAPGWTSLEELKEQDFELYLIS